MSEERSKIATLLGNRRLVNAVVSGLVIAFGILYVVQVNSAASKGLALRALEDRHSELTVESQRLVAKIDQLRSIDSVTQREQLLGLVKAERVSYITTGDDVVALR